MEQTTTISVRNISVDIWQKVKAGAALKHQTVPEFLNALLDKALLDKALNGKGK